MGLQPIQKRHANKELDVLLSQDFRCCCCRCRCPGERSLSVISSLFNTGRWRRAAPPRGNAAGGLPTFSLDVHLTWSRCALTLFPSPDISLSYTHIHTHSHFFSVPQIKEAADIIQKLHLIAQELPFDR